MSQTFKGQVKIPQPKEGIIRGAALDDMISDEKSLEMSLNFQYDSIGRATARNGLSVVYEAQVAAGGSNPTNTATRIRTMGTYNKNASTTDNRLLTAIYYGTSGNHTVGAWNPASPGAPVTTSTLSGVTATAKVRFAQFVDYTYIVSGNAGDVVKTYNVASGFGTSNTGSLQKGDFIETYGGRIWIANQANDRIYYSDVVSSTGVISGGTSYLGTLSPQDGEQITALKRFPKALLVFKENHIFRIYSTDSADSYPCANVGTFSSESVIDTKDGLYFHHSSGFYKFVADQPPVEISQRIKDFVQAIPRASYGDIFAWVEDDKIHWYVGDVTIGDITYSNCACVYTISKEVWSIYSFRRVLSSAVSFDDDTAIRPLVAGYLPALQDLNSPYASTGPWMRIYQSGVGVTDDGSEIPFEIITRWAGYTAMPSKIKSFGMIAVQHENMAGTTVQYQIDNNGENTWEDIGRLTEDYISELPLKFPREFRRARLRLSGFFRNKMMGTEQEYYPPLQIQIEAASSTRYIYKSIDIPLLEDSGYDTV